MSGIHEFLVAGAPVALAVLVYVALVRVTDAVADWRRRRAAERIAQEKTWHDASVRAWKQHRDGDKP